MGIFGKPKRITETYKGEKALRLNQGDEYIRLAGLVRMDDINRFNQVSSQNVANARISYAGRGVLNDSNSAGWLTRCGVEPTEQRVTWAKQILANQPAATVYAMSRSLVGQTESPDFLGAVRRVVDRGIRVHLIAGENDLSRRVTHVTLVIKLTRDLSIGPPGRFQLGLDEPRSRVGFVHAHKLMAILI